MSAAALVVFACGACGACSSSSTTTSPPKPTAKQVPVGRLETSSELMGTTQEIRAAGTQVPLDQLGALDTQIGLPISGLADVDVRIDVPNASAALITGHASLVCTKCRLGDDVAKLQLKTKSAFTGGGIDVGHLDFDRIEVGVAIENGRAEIKTWKVESPDLAIEVSGHVDLATQLPDSQVAGCIRFKPSPTLEARDPKTFAVITITGAPRGDDGFYSIELAGTIGDMKRLGKACH